LIIQPREKQAIVYCLPNLLIKKFWVENNSFENHQHSLVVIFKDKNNNKRKPISTKKVFSLKAKLKLSGNNNFQMDRPSNQYFF
jgi:hypothetical protein